MSKQNSSELDRNLKEVVGAVDADRLPDDLESAGKTMDRGAAGKVRGLGETIDAFGAAISRSGEGLKVFGEGIGEEVAKQGREDGGLAGEILTGVVGEAAEAMIETTGSLVGGMVKGAGEFVEGVGEAVNDLGDGLSNIADGEIGEGAGKIASGVAHFADGIKDAAVDVSLGSIEGVGEIVEGGVEMGAAVVVPLAEAAEDALDYLTAPTMDLETIAQSIQQNIVDEGVDAPAEDEPSIEFDMMEDAGVSDDAATDQGIVESNISAENSGLGPLLDDPSKEDGGSSASLGLEGRAAELLAGFTAIDSGLTQEGPVGVQAGIDFNMMQDAGISQDEDTDEQAPADDEPNFDSLHGDVEGSGSQGEQVDDNTDEA